MAILRFFELKLEVGCLRNKPEKKKRTRVDVRFT